MTAGVLDTGFNPGGFTSGPTAIGAGAANDHLRGLGPQADAKIVAAGYSATGGASAVALARFTPKGALDPSFGSSGKVVLNVGAENADALYALAIQPDGRLVGVGTSGTTAPRMLVMRFWP